jgi:hypothetical protein
LGGIGFFFFGNAGDQTQNLAHPSQIHLRAFDFIFIYLKLGWLLQYKVKKIECMAWMRLCPEVSHVRSWVLSVAAERW